MHDVVDAVDPRIGRTTEMSYVIRSILAPTDFSEHSHHALEYARLFAERWGASLHLLNVIEPAVFPAEGGLTPIGAMKIADDMEESANAHLHRMIERPELSGLTIQTSIAYGRASSGIIDYAAENGIDLIVIATHGRTGIEHLIFGSTAERVVREAPCPVLTVRPVREEEGD